MNYEDFDYLFKPSANTQAPILKRAIELAKNDREAQTADQFPRIVVNLLEHLKELCFDPDKHEQFKEKIYEEIDFLCEFECAKKIFDGFDKNKYIKKNPWKEKYYYNDTSEYLNSKFKEVLGRKIESQLNQIYEDEQNVKTKEEELADIPIQFNFQEMICKFMDNAITEQNQNSNRINEFLSTLRLRLRAFFEDERFNKPFMLKESEKNNLLLEFILYILGSLGEVGDNNIYQKFKYSRNEAGQLANVFITDKMNQVTIIDMSLLPYEVLESITGLIGRLILEFLSRFDKAGLTRGSVPTVIVLEEAQNYIPEKDRDTERISISKRVFERIAREGRKFGLSLLVSSQRPSELSKTILSQCNTFIVHRLQNPDDQKYIKQIVSSANEDILNQLPVLPQQHAIIMGDAVRSPIQVKLRDVKPKPKSENPEYFNNWTQGNPLSKEMVDKVVESWIGKGDSTKNHS
jgi:DNA helicase HerA-like ATPase